jgi:hypothetical protein
MWALLSIALALVRGRTGANLRALEADPSISPDPSAFTEGSRQWLGEYSGRERSLALQYSQFH